MEKMADISEICCNFLCNIEETSIIAICVPLIVAIFGLAYPIILSQASKIGNEYKSNSILDKYTSKIIDIKNRHIKINHFFFFLVLSLGSLIFHIFNFNPLFGWDNCFVNNSANLLTVISTFLLVISFFIFTKKISIYNNPVRLFEYLKDRYKKEKNKNAILKYHKEFALYSINIENENLEPKIRYFFQELLFQYRQDFLKKEKSDSLKMKIKVFFKKYSYQNKQEYSKEQKIIAIEYFEEYYKLIRDIVNECVRKNINNSSLGHFAISGFAFIPNDFQQIKISEKTYGWLWYNVTLIRHNIILLLNFGKILLNTLALNWDKFIQILNGTKKVK